MNSNFFIISIFVTETACFSCVAYDQGQEMSAYVETCDVSDDDDEQSLCFTVWMQDGSVMRQGCFASVPQLISSASCSNSQCVDNTQVKIFDLQLLK